MEEEKKYYKKKKKSEILSEQLDKILSTIELLTKRIENLELKIENEKTVKIEEKPVIKEEEKPKPESNFPVPMEYREIIASVLNNSFGIKIEPFAGPMPSFMLTIIVPEKYSNMSPEEKKVNKVDLRSKVITYAEGLNGVRMWAEQVFNNFNAETKAQIVADRAQLQ